MLPKPQRLSRTAFSVLSASKGLITRYNTLGTLKYLPVGGPALAVVTSGKHERRAVRRNKLRRRLYAAFGARRTALRGIFYASKHSYGFDYDETKRLFSELLDRVEASA